MALICAADHHTLIQIDYDYYIVMLCGHHIADVFRLDPKHNWWIVYENRYEPAARFIQASEAVRRYVANQTMHFWPEANINVVA